MYGCKDSATQQLTLFPSPIPVAYGDTICRGTYGTLSAQGGLYYDWGSLGATKVVQANPTVTTVYTVTVSDAIGCSASTTATIVVKDLPITVITNDSFCEGKSATLAALGGVTYNWGIQGATSSIVVFPAKSTRYPVLVKGPNGCEKLEYAWAYLRNKPGILAFPDTVCQGENAVITAGGGIAYNWGALGNTPTVKINNVMNSSSYPVTITDIHTCSNTGSVSVTVRNLPYITVENPTICVGANASVKANIFINGSTYNWGGSGAGQTITVNPTVTTEYKVTATDPFGCSVEGKSTVMVKSRPIVQINPSVIKSVCDDVRSINLEATPIGGMFYGTNVTFATFYPKVAQIGMFKVYYSYNEAGNNGCSGTDSIEINVKNCKVTTAINNIEGVSQITTYPNPFNNQFNIEIVVKENTNIQLSLIELTGKVVEIKNPELYQGINNIRFETGNIAAGSYILKVSKGSESMSIPIVKQ